ncbi:MAG: TIGR04014 family B12-binding domain/radical SAM domain-containing protein [Methanotrichaceae archaeon]|nr:TIGR04014 family B12-binding domain/radical SAM domain-containing protein [Methanotrichaceae archaeon]
MLVTIVSPGIYTYGSLVLGGLLRERGHDVNLTRKLESHGEVTLLSLFSTLQLMDQGIKDFVASQDTIYVGGPVGISPEMVMGELQPTALVTGEGEETVIPLVEDGPGQSIPNLAFSRGDEIIKTPIRPAAALDHPLPIIPPDLKEQNVRGANLYIETHRGCLGGCGFCQVPRFFGRSIRSRSLENVIEEVLALKEKGIRRIAISGGTGNLFGYKKELNKDAFLELLQALSSILGKRNLSVPDMRVDLVDREMLEAVRDYTIGWVFFGLESGSDKILKAMRKGVTAKANIAAVRLAQDVGVKVGGSFIVGYPGEEREEFQETVDFLDEAMLDDVFVSIAEPIPGTPLAREAIELPHEDNPLFQKHKGEYSPLKLNEAEARCLDLMIQAEYSKPVPRAITDGLFTSHLNEVRTQGRDIIGVYGLLDKYKQYLT